MAQMTKEQAVAYLRKDNPTTPLATLVIYVDTLFTYNEAMKSIDENGNIVFHPRTGSPIENPYLKVRESSSKFLEKSRLVVDPLWTLLRKEQAAERAKAPAPAKE